MEISPKEAFIRSLSRCRQRPDFLKRFYSRFMASSPEIARKFRFTDFDRQERMLLRSLELAASATMGDPDGIAELTERAETHDKDHLDITSEMYQGWVDALVATAAECDAEWSAEIENSWRQILSFVVAHMTHRYDPTRLHRPHGQ